MGKYKGICNAAIVIFVAFILFVFLWNPFFSEFIPWSKTNFKDYQAYRELLIKYHSFGWTAFVDKLPEQAEDEKYYWHKSWNEMKAAYSIVLPDEEIHKTVEQRVDAYNEQWDDWTNVQIYVGQTDNRFYIEQSQWFHEELEDAKQVLQNPAQTEEYYFALMLKLEGPSANRYSGVVLSESTNELMEFSFELPDEALTDYQDAWTLQEFNNY